MIGLKPGQKEKACFSETVVKEWYAFSLRSPSIDPTSELGQYNYFVNVDYSPLGLQYCAGLPKSMPIDWHKRRIDLGNVNLREI